MSTWLVCAECGAPILAHECDHSDPTDHREEGEREPDD